MLFIVYSHWQRKVVGIFESTDTHIATIIFLCVVECHMGVHACILRILEHTEFYTNGFDFLAAKHAKNI